VELKQIETTEASEPKGAPDSSDLTNSHTDKPQEPIAEGLEQPPAEEAKSGASEIPEVSEEAPKEDVHDAEANSADSEIKDSGDRGLDAEEAHPPSEASLSQKKEIESSPQEEPANLDLPREDVQPSSEATSTSSGPPSEAAPEKSKEAVVETSSAPMEGHSGLGEPAVTGEAKIQEPAIESCRGGAPSSLAEPTAIAEPKHQERFVETLPPPTKSQINNEVPNIIEDYKVEGSSPAPIERSQGQKSDESRAGGSMPGAIESTGQSDQGRYEDLIVASSETETVGNTEEHHVAKEHKKSAVEAVLVPVENWSSNELPIAVEETKTIRSDLDSLPTQIEREIEITALADKGVVPEYSRDSNQASLEPSPKEVEDFQATRSSEMKAEEREPAHEETAPETEEPVQSTDNGPAKSSLIPKFINSEVEEVQTSPQEEVKSAVVEDPEDIKAREEIARLNAELMKAAMREEAANESLATAASEADAEDKGTDQGLISHARQEEGSHHDTLELAGEHLPEPEHSDASHGHESFRELPVESQEPESSHEESPQITATENSAKTSSDTPDSAIDVRTPPQIAVDDNQNGDEVQEPSTDELKGNHEETNLVTSGIAEIRTLPIAEEVTEEPEVSQNIECENHQRSPPLGHEEPCHENFETETLETANEDPTFSSPSNYKPELQDSTINDTQAAEPYSGFSSDPSATSNEAEAFVRDHDLAGNEHFEVDSREEEYDAFHKEPEQVEEEEHKSLESELPSHPRTRALSAADDTGREFPRAEPPATVLNSDDLFEDDGKCQVEETTSHQIEAKYDDEDESEVRDHAETPVHFDGASTAQPLEQLHSRDTLGNELDVPLNKQHHISQETHCTNSGKFASLVDAVRSDAPIVSHLVKKQEVREIDMPGRGHFSDEILDEYDYETREGVEDDNEDFVGEIEAELHHSDSDDKARPSSPTLHIRTHTADTLASFETYAQSEDSAPSTPDTAISPPQQTLRDDPIIRQWWMHHGEKLQHHESNEELKPAASPLQQGEFDPFSTSAYPSYITPKASRAIFKATMLKSHRTATTTPLHPKMAVNTFPTKKATHSQAQCLLSATLHLTHPARLPSRKAGPTTLRDLSTLPSLPPSLCIPHRPPVLYALPSRHQRRHLRVSPGLPHSHHLQA
jgi:hypothetical protein